MIPRRLIKTWLPRMQKAAARHSLDPTLLLATAWVDSGLDPAAASDSAAARLADLLDRLALPRTALAALHAGSIAPESSTIPPESHRFARDVMAVWCWLRQRTGDVPANGKPRTAQPDAPDRTHPLICPVPGATREHCGLYEGALALDILVPARRPVVAAASGNLIQSETATGIWLALDEPFRYGKRGPYYLLRYANLSRVRFRVTDRACEGPHVEQGELIAWSGGGRVPMVSLCLIPDRTDRCRLEPFQLAACFGML